MLHIVKSFVGERFHGKDYSFLQVLGHLVGILVALLDEAVHQYRLSVGGKGFLAA